MAEPSPLSCRALPTSRRSRRFAFACPPISAPVWYLEPLGPNQSTWVYHLIIPLGPIDGARMRKADAAEALAASRPLPSQALDFALCNSTAAWTVLIKVVPRCYVRRADTRRLVGGGSNHDLQCGCKPCISH